MTGPILPSWQVRGGGSSQQLDVGPVPPTQPATARAAAVVMAGVAIRLDGPAADLGRVLDALGLREAS